MSFILDALKKSEAERKRQDAPGIASIPTPTARPSGHRWIWLLAGLLAINLLVLAGVVLKPALMETTGAPAEPAATNAAPVQAPGSRAAGPPADATPAVAVPAAAPPGPASTAPAATANALPAPAEAPAPQAAADAGLPTFEELRAAGRLQLPDLHIDIHVYSGQPADRFVFVNMTKYRENMSLAEGPVVSRITPDGVVLDYLGIRFLLPRE